MKPQYMIGVDVGGTFTDVICVENGTGSIRSAKVSSIPGEQWKGVLQSLETLGISNADVGVIAHGTTISTNTLLERKGAKTLFLTTSGFRDTLEIGKTRRLVGGLFDTRFQRPRPLVERADRIEITERMDASGEALVPLCTDDLETALARILTEEASVVAIGFVNAYVNDRHEAEAADWLRARLPEDVAIFTSSELTREKGEFERFSTTVLNAYLTPDICRYLDHLQAELARADFSAPVNVMSSNGGYMTIPRARRAAVRTFLSGPVGGVIGARALAAQSGISDFITFDMGGTSTDVALCAGAMPDISYDNLIEAFPSRVAQLDIHTIGAGGGSLASIGADGGLYVGPQSAGAKPGPAAYGRGGTRATITDANVVLGRLPVRNTLGGNVALDRDAAFAAVAALAGTDDAGTVVELAHAILKIGTLKMAGAVQEVTVFRGHDPREFHLLGFGGAGPMHVFLVAEELGIDRVLIPRSPGHVSAYGQILADAVHHFIHPFPATTTDPRELQSAADALRQRAAAQFVEDGFAASDCVTAFNAEVRYRGQSFTIEIATGTDAPDLTRIAADFHAAHERKFGHASPATAIEITALRAQSSIPRRGAAQVLPDDAADDAAPDHVDVYWDSGWASTPVHARSALSAGTRLTGPAIIEDQGATTVVPPGWIILRDAAGNLDCTRQTDATKGSAQ